MKKNLLFYHLAVRLIFGILLLACLVSCSGSYATLEGTYDLVQIDKLDENFKRNKETDVVFLIFYSYVNETETIEYQERYSYCYRRKDGGIIKDSITIENESIKEVVMYPLDEGEEPRLEIWVIEEGSLLPNIEYRFYVPEDTVLELYELEEKEEKATIEPDES